eukprot:scaffold8224_cov118-Isochrysis_galbana.AAC.13
MAGGSGTGPGFHVLLKLKYPSSSRAWKCTSNKSNALPVSLSAAANASVTAASRPCRSSTACSARSTVQPRLARAGQSAPRPRLGGAAPTGPVHRDPWRRGRTGAPAGSPPTTEASRARMPSRMPRSGTGPLLPPRRVAPAPRSRRRTKASARPRPEQTASSPQGCQRRPGRRRRWIDPRRSRGGCRAAWPSRARRPGPRPCP